MRVFTIGGYGFTEHTFASSLAAAAVDTLVDVRQRRGVRGRDYAFLNSTRLQNLLERRDIRYVHLKSLAPTKAIRDIQREADAAVKTAKRARQRLSPAFVAAYTSTVLSGFSLDLFRQAIGPHAQRVALFCVETRPEACHRSLIAARLAGDLGIEVTHILP